MKTYLIIDASNLIHRIFRAHIKDKEDVLLGMCVHSVLYAIKKYYSKYNPTDIVIAFDSEVKSWRKKYTDSPEAKTYKKYKGNRRQNLTESEKQKYELLDNFILEMKMMFKTQTSLLVLEGEELEADDVIAAFTQVMADDKCIILSSDNDFIQLLRNSNVTLINPLTDKPIDLAEWDFNADYFMFEKCIRGDSGDNVMSSYPRLRSDKIKQAFNDHFHYQNLLNNQFKVEFFDKDGTLITKEYVTKDVFEENHLLMNLERQPDSIKKKMYKAILNAIDNRGKFDYIKFLRFCGRHNLENVAKNVSEFTKVLSVRS
jgi:5'-3' exonuclease